MKRVSILLIAASLAFVAVTPKPAHALSDDEKKAIAMALALGIGIAAAKHGKDHGTASQWAEDLYGQPFSPSPDVVCLPRPQKCYKSGHLSYRWTRRMFGG